MIALRDDYGTPATGGRSFSPCSCCGAYIHSTVDSMDSISNTSNVGLTMWLIQTEKLDKTHRHVANNAHRKHEFVKLGDTTLIVRHWIKPEAIPE